MSKIVKNFGKYYSLLYRLYLMVWDTYLYTNALARRGTVRTPGGSRLSWCSWYNFKPMQTVVIVYILIVFWNIYLHSVPKYALRNFFTKIVLLGIFIPVDYRLVMVNLNDYKYNVYYNIYICQCHLLLNHLQPNIMITGIGFEF